MFIACFALGALAACLFDDRRAITSIFVAIGLLLLIAMAMGQSLVWFLSTIALFQFGLVLAGLFVAQIRRKPESEAEPRRRGEAN